MSEQELTPAQQAQKDIDHWQRQIELAEAHLTELRAKYNDAIERCAREGGRPEILEPAIRRRARKSP